MRSEAIIARGSFGYSPTPGTKPVYNWFSGPKLFLFRGGSAVVQRDFYTPPVAGGLRLPMAILVDVQIGDAGVAVIAQPAPRLRFADLAPAGGALLAGSDEVRRSHSALAAAL